MSDTQVALWTEAIKKTGTGTLFTDDDGFVGVELEFGFHAKHPANLKVLLREWVADIPGAAWKGEKTAWVVPDVRDIPRGALKAAGFVVLHSDGQPARPSDFTAPPAPPLEPVAPLTELPKWFAIEPYDEQLDGAKQIVAGKHFLGDDPGTGKTIIGLAVAAMMQSTRTLVLCKPVALTHWQRTSEKSGLPAHVNGEAVVIRTGRKQPPLPTTGIVIVSAALVTNRPELASELAAWQPTLFLFDESQQVMTWTSRRSRVLRRLAQSCTVSIPLTGTPSPSGSPLDLPAQLDIAGLLEPTFGSYLDYRAQYCRRTKFGWKHRKDRLKELNEKLETLWVRRTSKSERIVRSPLEVDINRKGYEESLAVLYEKIDEWLTEFKDERNRPPDEDEIKEWCSGRGDLTSHLREAAGLAKVPAALEFIKEHRKEHQKKFVRAGSHDEYPSPLIVWAHHHSVTAALMEELAQYDPMLIDGMTSHTQRARAEDEYQAGHVGVLVASIQAAGTSITLTRGNEQLFVELDWTPDNIIQAEARQDRIGQTSDTVLCTTLVADGTLDERVADVLFGKGGDLEVMTRGDHAVIGKSKRRATGPVFASTLLAELVSARLELVASSPTKA
jgi:hypothetical protein